MDTLQRQSGSTACLASFPHGAADAAPRLLLTENTTAVSTQSDLSETGVSAVAFDGMKFTAEFCQANSVQLKLIWLPYTGCFLMFLPILTILRLCYAIPGRWQTFQPAMVIAGQKPLVIRYQSGSSAQPSTASSAEGAPTSPSTATAPPLPTNTSATSASAEAATKAGSTSTGTDETLDCTAVTFQSYKQYTGPSNIDTDKMLDCMAVIL